jgi:hypothetical protein
MREIKFRVWDKKLKKMMSNNSIDFSNVGLTGKTFYIENTSVLLQYTGLKDKNGKEIYEGDIVADKRVEDKKRRIEWSVESAGWYPFSQCSDPSLGWECGNELSVEKCEVIGNIYENPELLTNSQEEKTNIC